MDKVTFLTNLMMLVSLFIIGVIIRVLYLLFVKKKTPTLTYPPYDDAMNGEKKE